MNNELNQWRNDHIMEIEDANSTPESAIFNMLILDAWNNGFDSGVNSMKNKGFMYHLSLICKSFKNSFKYLGHS